jgi:uncharacterized protein (TIGR04222 family)
VSRAFVLALLALWVGITPAAAQRSLAIKRFDATIRVERDASIDVTETIVAQFTGSWNGIYRSIPVKYRTAQGFNWTLGLNIEGATDGEGRPLKIETSRERHYVKIKIWVPGAQNVTRTVVLSYRATNALRFFDEHDELYWNVTGDEWDVPIEAATAQIELPAGTEGVRAIAFNGVYGSRAQDASVETSGTTVRIAMPQALGFHEGLTAVVGWNKGVVAEPTAAARATGMLASNWPLAIPIPVFFAMFLAWRRRGKDPRPRPVAVQYEPPQDITPAEAGTLLDNSVDMRDITATLVDLAVRGYLRFEEREDSKFFGLISGREYVMHRLNPAKGANGLTEHERLVLDGVFSGRGSSVELSELEDEFYSELPGIKASIFDRLRERGFYRARPDRVRSTWGFAALVLGGLVGIGGSVLADRVLLTPVPFIVAGVLVAIIVFVFSRIMPARTVAGARALEQVLGFEEFQRRVDSEHFKRVIVGHPEWFDKYLPFAMAFGVEKKWARAFEGIYTERPRWYTGSSGGADFHVSRLSNSLSSFSSRAGSTLSSSPRSSGGSGFGGGGGSGGGGGGGGGGGF